jgi:cytoskeleton protein RodZ
LGVDNATYFEYKQIMDVGTQLREARVRRGLTLDAVRASTKVSKAVLEHIDQNRFDKLPGGILTRGHVRAYARVVGLDPERIVDDYIRQWFAGRAEELPLQPPPPLEGEPRVPWLWIIELSVVLVAFVLYSAYQRSSPSPGAPSALDGRPWAGPADLISHQDEEQRDIRIVIGASGPCWVSATADGAVVIRQLLQRGEQVAAEARNTLVLRVGAPEAVVYWLNGMPGRTLGPAGRPITVEITEENVETFLTPTGTPHPSPPPTSARLQHSGPGGDA